MDSMLTAPPRPASPPLPPAQALFMQHVSAETLLVGHSLDNDLLALRIVHARVLDTAIMYPHPRGPPYKSALKVRVWGREPSW